MTGRLSEDDEIYYTADLAYVVRGNFEIMTAEEAVSMTKPKPQHVTVPQILRFFNITPFDFQNRWRPIIYPELRKLSPLRDEKTGRRLRWYEVSHSPKNLAVMQEFGGPIGELWEALPIEKTACTSKERTWKDGDLVLPGLTVVQLGTVLTKMVKRECRRMQKHPELQEEGTRNELQVRNTVNKSASPEKQPAAKERAPKKLKGRGVLFIVPIEFEERWQSSQSERNLLKRDIVAGVKFRFDVLISERVRASAKKLDYKADDCKPDLLFKEVRSLVMLEEFTLSFRVRDASEFTEIEEDGDIELAESIAAMQEDQKIEENEYALFITAVASSA